MEKPCSSHEFFIEKGDGFRVEVEPHTYFLNDLDDEGPEEKAENSRLNISSGESEWEIKISIPIEALKKLIQVAQDYLKDGRGHVFMTPIPRPAQTKRTRIPAAA